MQGNISRVRGAWLALCATIFTTASAAAQSDFSGSTANQFVNAGGIYTGLQNQVATPIRYTRWILGLILMGLFVKNLIQSMAMGENKYKEAILSLVAAFVIVFPSIWLGWVGGGFGAVMTAWGFGN